MITLLCGVGGGGGGSQRLQIGQFLCAGNAVCLKELVYLCIPMRSTNTLYNRLFLLETNNRESSEEANCKDCCSSTIVHVVQVVAVDAVLCEGGRYKVL